MINPFGKAIGILLVNGFVVRRDILEKMAMKEIIICIDCSYF
jgi:hypothetical protein